LLEYYPTIKDNDGNNVLAQSKKTVAQGSIRLLLIFIDYCFYWYAQLDPITDWTTVTHNQFNTFRMMPNYMLAKNTIGKTMFTKEPNPVVIDDYYQLTQPPAAQMNGPTTSGSPTKLLYAKFADQFLKGIKCNLSLFQTLKDEKFHDSWHCSFQNQMHS